MRTKGTKYWKDKRKSLKLQKREAMKRDFEISGDRNKVLEGFKTESRALKRGEKNEVKREIKKIIEEE